MREKIKDEELMMMYKSGDCKAFQELYERYSRRVYGYIYHKKGLAPDKADDVFQSVFMKLHRTRERYDSKHNFQAWLFTIARSVLIDNLRSEGRKLQEEPVDENLRISSEKEEVLDIPLDKLSSSEREVIELRYLQEKDFKEMAELMGLTPAGARQRVSRAIKSLREIFGRDLK